MTYQLFYCRDVRILTYHRLCFYFLGRERIMKNRKWPFKYHDKTQLLLLFPPLIPAYSGCYIKKAHLCVHLVLKICILICRKETPRRRITVTSSLNEISTDQLGNRVVHCKEDSNLYSKKSNCAALFPISILIHICERFMHCILRIGLSVLLQPNRQTDRGSI
jgi:hypothetical protein